MNTPQSNDGFAICCDQRPGVELVTIESDPRIRVVECFCPECHDFAHGKCVDECRIEWNRKKGGGLC